MESGMDIGVILMGVLSLAAAVLAGFAFWRSGKTPTVETALESVSAGLSDIETAAGAAKEYVAAAEQLWKTGRLDKEGRLGYALGRLAKAYPWIPEETLIDSLEAGVTWLHLAEAKAAPASPFGIVGVAGSDGVTLDALHVKTFVADA